MRIVVIILVSFSLGCVSRNRDSSLKNERVHTITVGTTSVTAASLDKYHPEENFLYFRVTLKDLALSAAEPLNRDHLNFGIEQDFKLVSGVDTVFPMICQRMMNGRSREYEYLLSFQHKKQQGQTQLLYNDEVFSIGHLAFIFDPLPEIKQLTQANLKK